MKEQQNISENSASVELNDNITEEQLPDAIREREEKAKQRKKKRRIRRYIFFFVLLIPLFYLIMQIRSIWFRPYVTQTAIEITMSDAVQTKGIVVRSEVPLYKEQDGVIGYLIEDGTRVPIGTAVAALYANEESAAKSKESKETALKIESLIRVQTPNASSADIGSLTKNQQSNLYAYLTMLEKKDYSSLQDTALPLTESINCLQLATGRIDNFDTMIAGLAAEKEQLDAESKPIETCQSTTAGFFISETDGYETKLLPEDVLSWDVPTLENVLKNGIQAEPSAQTVGKIVTDYKWHFVCVMSQKQAEIFIPYEGTHNKVRLIFESSAQLDVPAYVQTIEKTEDGKAKVVFRVETMNPQVASLRFEQTDVSVRTIKGLRIDKEALHVENGQYGVYVRHGNVAKYRRITPVFENEQYVLVPIHPSEEKGQLNEVEMFDDIIVKGKDLYDGKLLKF